MRALPLLLLLGACATAPACPPGLQAASQATLAFGRNAGGQLRVTEAEWGRFLAEEATTRFPDGLTVVDAYGQWRGSSGRVEREPAKLLWIMLPGTAPEAAAARIAPLAEAYRQRFGQEAVLRAVESSCVGF